MIPRSRQNVLYVDTLVGLPVCIAQFWRYITEAQKVKYLALGLEIDLFASVYDL